MNFAGPERWKHQEREFQRSKDAPYWALLMEQRCGKTPVLLDTVAHLYLSKRITAFIYIAPNGVHAQLPEDYLSVYLPQDIPFNCHVWDADRYKLASHRLARESLIKLPGLSILCLNTEALVTKNVRQYLPQLLKARPTLVAIDESIDISNRKAGRTKVAIYVGLLAAYRRILDGTPLDAGPLGVWSQCEFLQPGSLGFQPSRIARGKLVFPGYWSFANRYAEWEEDFAQGHKFKRIVLKKDGTKKYRNLDELSQKMRFFSSRVTRSDCRDMPEKVFERRTFELSSKQRKIYDELRRDFLVELEGSRTLAAPNVLVRYLRLQQIASNFTYAEGMPEMCPACEAVGCDECAGYGYKSTSEEITLVDDDPRLACFSKAVEQLPPGDGVIVWARFRRDMAALVAWAEQSKRSYVRYDGTVSTDDRLAAKRSFQKGKVDFFFGNPVAAGRGTDLSRASAVIYYSHMWSLRWRRQSEDRAQNLTKNFSTLYIPLIARDTVDERIEKVLHQGRDLADDITTRIKLGGELI